MSLADTVLADAPYSYMKCDEESGALIDASGNSRNGSPSGATYRQATLTPTGTYSLRIGGIQISAPSGTTWALEMWRSHAEIASSISYIATVNVLNGCNLQVSPDGHMSVYTSGSGANILTDTGCTANSLDGRHHVWVSDGSEVRMYGNGALIGTAALSASLHGGGYVGTNPFTAESFNIEHLAIYETAITAERVLAHYQAGMGTTPPPPDPDPEPELVDPGRGVAGFGHMKPSILTYRAAARRRNAA